MGEIDARAIYRVKALILALVLGWVWVLQIWISPTSLAPQVSLCVLPAWVAASAVTLLRRPPSRGEIAGTLALDMVALTGAVHFGGGLDHVSGVLLYVLVVLLSGLLVHENAAFLFAAMGALLYDSMGLLEYAEWLPHRVAYRRPPDRQLATVIMVNVYLIVIAWVVWFAFRWQREARAAQRAQRTEALRAMAHDLKTPLSSIYGYASLVSETLPPGAAPEAREFVGRITAVAADAVDLVHDVLETVTAEPRPLVARPSRVDLAQVLAAAAQRMQWLARESAIELVVVKPVDPALVELDETLLARALNNLLVNGLRHTPRGGAVELGARLDVQEVVFWVADSGAGMSMEQYRQIESQAERGFPSGTTSGLGLLIVKRVAEAHGGRLELEANPGSGSRFTLILPQPARC